MFLNIPFTCELFPSLNRPDIFFDNPGGTQISRPSAWLIQRYLLECNANRQSEAVLAEAHAARRVPRSKSFPYRSHLNKRDLAHHQRDSWLSRISPLRTG